MRTNIEAELTFPRPDHTPLLNECLEDIERLDATISQLLAIARTDELEGATVDVVAVIDDVANGWRGRFAIVGRPLRIDHAAVVPAAHGDAVRLGNALDVLLDNALVHGAGEARIGVTANAASVTITVTDHGPGFGDPTHSGPSDASHGLGLALAARLVEAMSARLVVAHAGPNPTVAIVLRTSTEVPATVDEAGR
jgi:signal transduction histidine kinase